MNNTNKLTLSLSKGEAQNPLMVSLSNHERCIIAN